MDRLSHQLGTLVPQARQTLSKWGMRACLAQKADLPQERQHEFGRDGVGEADPLRVVIQVEWGIRCREGQGGLHCSEARIMLNVERFLRHLFGSATILNRSSRHANSSTAPWLRATISP